MKVYVFGNIDVGVDNKPLLYLPLLKKDFPGINFVEIKPNQDLPFENDVENEDTFYIFDTVEGLSEIKILDESSIDKLSRTANSSVHDYDLGFQLKYLKKLGKINKIKILGIPMNMDIPYNSFHSSFKKFVAQDIQGS
jgi:Ni,Fe-hydrogenase maturation factor